MNTTASHSHSDAPARSRGLSGSTLKLIAIASMLIDHIGAVILGRGLLHSAQVLSDPALNEQLKHIYYIMRLLGRPAFPIFCFLLVEGFLHTRDAGKYALRLFLFALISEIPFDLALFGHIFAPGTQNVFFTLLIGLLVMMSVSRYSQNMWARWLIYSLGLLAGYIFHTDYGFKGVFLIELLYFFRYDRGRQCIAGAVAFSWEPTAPLAFLPIWAYNGQRGLSLKYFFYLFYPVHLLILGLCV